MGKGKYGKYLRLLKPWQYDIDRQKKISIWWRMKSVLWTSSKVAEFNLSWDDIQEWFCPNGNVQRKICDIPSKLGIQTIFQHYTLW